MIRANLAILSLALLSFTYAVPAYADNFSFSYNNGTDGGSGVFIGTPTATPNVFLITGITGSAEGQIITSLMGIGVYPGPDTNYTPPDDNLLYDVPNQPSLDLAGISFTLADGTEINFYYNGLDQSYAIIDNDTAPKTLSSTDIANLSIVLPPSVPGGPTTVPEGTTAATPEPSSCLLLGSGMLALAALVRRRRAIH